MEKNITQETLFRIEERLQEIVNLLKISQKIAIEETKMKLLGGSKIRKGVYELCDGKTSVNDIATKLKKSTPKVSKYLSELQQNGLVKEMRIGKKKYYRKLI